MQDLLDEASAIGREAARCLKQAKRIKQFIQDALKWFQHRSLQIAGKLFLQGLYRQADLADHRSDHILQCVPLFLQDTSNRNKYHQGAEAFLHLEARKHFKAAFRATVQDDKQVLNSTEADVA